MEQSTMFKIVECACFIVLSKTVVLLVLTDWIVCMYLNNTI